MYEMVISGNPLMGFTNGEGRHARRRLIQLLRKIAVGLVAIDTARAIKLKYFRAHIQARIPSTEWSTTTRPCLMPMFANQATNQAWISASQMSLAFCKLPSILSDG